MILSPEEFLSKAQESIYKGLNGECTVKAAMMSELNSKNPMQAPMLLIARDKEQPFALPLVQTYKDYVEMFNGNMNAYCEDICKQVMEFDEFTHSDEELEVEY